MNRAAIACENAREAALDMAARLSSLPRGPLKAVKRLVEIQDPTRHLEAALDYQVGFITDPQFAAFAQALLSR